MTLSKWSNLKETLFKFNLTISHFKYDIGENGIIYTLKNYHVKWFNKKNALILNKTLSF